MLGTQAHDVAREQIVHQDHVRTDAKCGGELAEPGVKTQR